MGIKLNIVPDGGIYLGKFFVSEITDLLNTSPEWAIKVDAARVYPKVGKTRGDIDYILPTRSQGAKYAVENKLHPDLDTEDHSIGGACIVMCLNKDIIIQVQLVMIKGRDEKYLQCWMYPSSDKITAKLANEAILAFKEYLFEYGFVNTIVSLLPATDDSTPINVTLICAWCVRNQEAEKFDEFILFNTPFVKAVVAYQQRDTYYVGKYSDHHKI